MKLQFYRWSLVIPVFLVCLGIYLRWEAHNVAFINEWVTRDFDRAFNIIDGTFFPLAGPEATNGGRLPGPFLYIILAFPLLFSYSYDSLIFFNLVWNLMGMALFFWVIKKYINTNTAITTIVLISIFLPHINVFTFPINPSFIFPLVVLFLWFLFEYVLNLNYKMLPLIFLTASLAIQIHYSMATFFVIPFIATFLFRIKVPWRFLILTLGITIICFIPYLFHKSTVFEVTPFSTSSNSSLIQTISFYKIINIFLAKNTLLRLTYYNGMNSELMFSDTIASLYYFLMYGSFLALTIIICFMVRRGGLDSCKKEIIILLFFYIPALFYEFNNPIYTHLWYYYIFIFPIFLIIGYVLTIILKNIKIMPLKFIWISLILVQITIITIDTWKEFNKYKVKSSTQITGTFKNSELLFKTLLKDLNLEAHEFYENVFMDDVTHTQHVGFSFTPFSLKRLQLIKGFKKKITKPQLTKNCFYIADNYLLLPIKKIQPFLNQKQLASRQRLETFLKEETIKISSEIRLINFNKLGFNKRYRVYKYIPKSFQPCFNNSFNPFNVEKGTHHFLKEVKSLNFNKNPVNLKVITHIEKYNSKNNLEHFKTHYILLNKLIQLPIKLDLKIKQKGSAYTVRWDIESYGFQGVTASAFKSSELNLILKQKPVRENKLFKITRFSILGDSWMERNLNSHTQFSINWTNKLKWFREFNWDPQTLLQENRWSIELEWISKGRFNAANCCKSDATLTNRIILKEFTKSQTTLNLKKDLEDKIKPRSDRWPWRKYSPIIEFFM